MSLHAEHAEHWIPTADTFGARLAQIRHVMDWNAKEAALACGVAPQNWREWETSDRHPRNYEGICKQIAERTKCDLIWLMTGNPSYGKPIGGLPLPRLDSNQQPFDYGPANSLPARLYHIPTRRNVDSEKISA